MPHVRIGTSGWVYKDWSKGQFYPAGLPQRERLSYYARRFDTVEINSSFYRLLSPAAVERWTRPVPARFRFAIKLSRLITHGKKLDIEGANAELLHNFFERANLLGPRRGPLLVQLGPAWRRDDGRLAAFLAGIRRHTLGVRWKVAVEFRHRSWICDEVAQILDRHGATRVVHDMPGGATPSPNARAKLVYVRRHGPRGDYRGSYGAPRLKRDAADIPRWLDEGRDVWAYFNNDYEAKAPRDAQRLRRLLEQDR